MKYIQGWMWMVCLTLCVIIGLPDKASASYTFDYEAYKKTRECADLPDDQKPPEIIERTKTDEAYAAYLESIGVPFWINVNGQNYPADKVKARTHCILVYGNWAIVQPATGQQNTLDGSEFRYLGVVRTETGEVVPVPNQKYPDICGTCDKYLKVRNFIHRPWEGEGNARIMNYKSANVPAPTGSFDRFTNFLWYIWYPLDPFNGSDKDPNGYFDVKNDYTGEPMLNWNVAPYAPRLAGYASAIAPATDYGFGIFVMYSDVGTASNPEIRYRTFIIPPGKCFLVCETEGNVNVGAAADKAVFEEGEKITGYIDIGNNHFGVVNAPCDTSGKANPVCDNNKANNVATIKITNTATGAVVVNKEFLYWGIPYGNTNVRDIEIGNLNITLPRGNYSARVDIPHYDKEVRIGSGSDEPYYADNAYAFSFKVKGRGNASVAVSGPDTYTAGEKVTHVATATNKMSDKIDGTLRVKIYEKTASGNVLVWQSSPPYNDLAVNGKFKVEPKPELPAGKYIITADIPHYTEAVAPFEDETNYTDNHDEKEFTVSMFSPKHVNCKSLDVDYTKVLGVGNKNIVRMCVGQTPEFPSTEIEAGQETYYYVGYRLLPMPIPAYKVVNNDAAGMDQTLTLQEPSNKLGGCDPKTTDTNCKITKTFLHFPTTTNAKAPAPYTLGTESNYHYAYRGRMFPEKVRFQFDILDPSGKKVEASGNLVYKIDSSCYDTTVLDIKEECRAIDFYIPKLASDTKGTESAPYVVPFDGGSTVPPTDGSTFKNPGLHTFELKVVEEQIYLYQKDGGAASGSGWSYNWSNVQNYGKLN